MTHYDENQWIDYVRALPDVGASRDLESHLESGCPACRATAMAFNRVATMATRETESD